MLFFCLFFVHFSLNAVVQNSYICAAAFENKYMKKQHAILKVEACS